jgi:predicted alpha/beta hydrolase
MPEYFYDDPEWDARQRAGKITLPILVLGFDDDPGLIQKPSHACLLQRKTQK